MTKTVKILVADKLADEGIKKLQSTPGVEVVVKAGLDEAGLIAALADKFDGMIIRSGVQITGKVLENAHGLRAIARAGVGVDNVDLETATKVGVLVMNTPDANTISTAEHTLAMMLALSRRIPEADQLTHAGKFKEGRKSCVGAQLAGKTLGVVGLGRIGRAVAARALAFEMNVIGFDPFFSGESALEGQVKMFKSVEDLLPQVDYLTVHTPLTDATRNMVGKAQLTKMKKTARLVNVARGGLYNETELAEALNAGVIAGAAVDVYEQEPPPADHPLLKAKNAVLTPHLGASTEEAQLAVTMEAIDEMLDYLLQDQIKGAVNVAGLPGSFSERDKRYVDLARRLGMVAAPLLLGGIKSVRLEVYGTGLDKIAGALSRFALIELLRPILSTPPNIINIDLVAKQRELDFAHSAHHAGAEGGERLVLKVDCDGGAVCTEGAVYHSVDNLPRLLNVSGYRMDIVPEGCILMIFNHDQPGVVGLVGTLLGKSQVNIADMTLSRQGDKAMMLLKVDEPIPEKVLNELRALPPVRHVQQVTLPPTK